MSRHSEKPPRDEEKLRLKNEGRTFKKEESVHWKPGVTDHDFHVDLMKDPPTNVRDGDVEGFSTDGMKANKKFEKEREERGAGDMPFGLFEERGLGLGRAKPSDVQTELIDMSESTLRA